MQVSKWVTSGQIRSDPIQSNPSPSPYSCSYSYSNSTLEALLYVCGATDTVHVIYCTVLYCNLPLYCTYTVLYWRLMILVRLYITPSAKAAASLLFCSGARALSSGARARVSRDHDEAAALLARAALLGILSTERDDARAQLNGSQATAGAHTSRVRGALIQYE